VTEDNLAALGDTLFITRLPATYNLNGARNSRRIVDLLKKQTVASVM
jgi:hypothetical protein